MALCPVCDRELVGLRSDAKYCSTICGNRARNRTHYKRNQGAFEEKRRKENANVEKRIHSRVKSRAKGSGIQFDLDVSDIVVPEVCPVLGMAIVSTNKGSGYHTNSPSVDRIDPTKGYTKGNVRIISARANLLKSDATAHELRLVLQDLERLEDDN
jgi:hypothetical protein